MEVPDKKIVEFLKIHHVLTLATTIDNQPWCANCFYAFNEQTMNLIFTSGYETRHIKEGTQNPKVAGSIVLETSVVGKIQGIQFSGELLMPEGELADLVNHVYLKRFPFAALMDTTLWTLRIDYAKMTDNRLGFGKKLIWER
ncbi:MAG: pyridoxamine 5'-phosphate oxidase family protein [Mariniphaga sp.]